MAPWHPVADAQPAEWLLRQNPTDVPYAVVRRFVFGDPRRPEVWFRVVTGAPRSTDRELIGWCRTLEAAAAAGWDHRCAEESWRRHLASSGSNSAAPTRVRPAAAEMVRFYRAALRRRPSAGTMERRPSGRQ
ncbi:hypothetical protein [Leifsonia poae]|uniref:hypothetical protein n=1 Tax=Leifsonia poae TaxID=110933 RepID=UPI001CC0D9BB|nr:hypothetical protein [Leifsonia poae]